MKNKLFFKKRTQINYETGASRVGYDTGSYIRPKVLRGRRNATITFITGGS